MDERLAEQQTTERHAEWPDRLPRKPEALCIFIHGFSDDERMGLLAHCVSLTVNAIRAPNQYGRGVRPRFRQRLQSRRIGTRICGLDRTGAAARIQRRQAEAWMISRPDDRYFASYSHRRRALHDRTPNASLRLNFPHAPRAPSIHEFSVHPRHEAAIRAL